MLNNPAWNCNFIIPVVTFYVSWPCSLLLDTKESKYTSKSCLCLIFHSTDYYKCLNCHISQKTVSSSEMLLKEPFFFYIFFFNSASPHL